MEIKDRILEVIKRNNLTASMFADKIGVQRSSLSHILSGRNKPSIDFIEKFIVHFPNEDINWLITGVKTLVRNNEIKKENPKLNNFEVDFKSNASIKYIEKIVTFYNDKTFDVYEVNS